MADILTPVQNRAEYHWPIWQIGGSVALAAPQPFTGLNYDTGNVFFLPNAQAFEQSIQTLLRDWDQLRELSMDVSEESDEVSVDHSSLERLRAAAIHAPDLSMTEEDKQAYQGLSHFSYTLDIDYDEE